LKKILFSAVILVLYFIIPFFLINEAEAADNHYVRTLRNIDQHQGKYFEVDRGTYEKSGQGGKFITPFKKEYMVIGKVLAGKGTMSIKAKFISEDRIELIDYHFHSAPLRDIPSYIGLFLIFLIAFIIYKKSLKISRQRNFSGKEIPDSVN